MSCYDDCKKNKTKCQVKDCRLWIDHPADLNCTEIAVQNTEGNGMVLREIAQRLKLTPSRIKQIENNAISKLNETFKILEIL
jgi:DNA-binding NarL/FixJ family response regulator